MQNLDVLDELPTISLNRYISLLNAEPAIAAAIWVLVSCLNRYISLLNAEPEGIREHAAWLS